MNAVLYIRVSTDHQGAGIQEQIEACQQKAKSLGLSQWQIFIDEHVSHKTPIEARAGLSRALLSLKQHDIFISYDCDRISRDAIQKARFYHIVRRLEVSVAFVFEKTLAEQYQRVSWMQTNAEVEYCNQETKKALQEKKAQGKLIGVIPYGFKLAQDKATLEQEPYEQKVIKLIEILKNTKNYSLRAIVKELKLKDIKARNNNPLGLTQVARIVSQLPSAEHKNKKGKKNLVYGFRHTLTGSIELCPVEQKIIKIICSLRQQSLSIRTIAKYINSLGYRNRVGNAFGISQVHAIIKRNTQEKSKKVRASYGFIYCQDTRSLKLLEQEQKVISYAIGLKQAGYSLRAIVAELHNQGYKNRKNKPFSLSQVRALVRETKNNNIKHKSGKNHLAYGQHYGHTNNIESCPKEQEIITVAYTLRQEGLSLNEIAHELNQKGYRNRAQTKFQASHIARILKQVNHEYT